MKEVVESSRLTLNKTADKEAKEDAVRKINDFLQHSTKQGTAFVNEYNLPEKFATLIGLIAPLVLLGTQLFGKQAVFVHPLRPGGYHHGEVKDKEDRELPFDTLHNFV